MQATQRLLSLVLAALLTAGMLAGIDRLAQPDFAAEMAKASSTGVRG